MFALIFLMTNVFFLFKREIRRSARWVHMIITAMFFFKKVLILYYNH